MYLNTGFDELSKSGILEVDGGAALLGVAGLAWYVASKN